MAQQLSVVVVVVAAGSRLRCNEHQGSEQNLPLESLPKDQKCLVLLALAVLVSLRFVAVEEEVRLLAGWS